MTWVEWCYYAKGKEKAKVKEWEHTRAIAWMLYKTNADPKKAAKVMTAWWPLPTDAGIIKNKTVRKKGKRLTKTQLTDFINNMRI